MTEHTDILNLAARLALRAAGDVEPNPMVGAVLVRDGVVLGMGHHRRFGGLHAEREALADCRRRGNDPRGSTAFVTLEPCCHHGKQPPCTDALIEAGVARVVYARPDPHAVSGGGADVLRRAGIACELCGDSPLATRLSDPFVKRVTTGLPWVIAKWAQTPDGRLVTRPDEPRWISNELSLKRVHRLRARVDAVITGIGTVLADDPLLTARGVRRMRRHPRRAVVLGAHELPRCARIANPPIPPLMLVDPADSPDVVSASYTTDYGQIEHVYFPGADGRVDLERMLRYLMEKHGATNILLECGPTLLGAFARADLIDEAFVFAAPDSDGVPTGADALGPPSAWLASLAFVRSKPLAGDTEHWFRRIPAHT